MEVAVDKDAGESEEGLVACWEMPGVLPVRGVKITPFFRVPHSGLG